MASKAVRYAVYSSMIVTGLSLTLLRGAQYFTEKKEDPEVTNQTQLVAKDAYIVSEDLDQTLHCGSIIKTSSGDYVLSFNCGEVLFGEEFKAYTKEPSTDTYKHKCTTCFEKEKDL